MFEVKIIKMVLIVIIALIFVKTGVFADSRNYAWTYQYDTLPAGLLELEMYSTTELRDAGDIGNSKWRQWFEIEYGLTDSTDVALYQKFLQENGAVSSFKYDGFKIRLRHKAAKKDYFPVDFLFYIEYERSSDLTETDVIEWKEVMAKDIDKLNISYNMIFEYQPKNNWRYEHKYALGVSYEIINNLKIGVESSGSYSEKKYYLGPTLSLLQPDFWLNFGPQWGMNGNSNSLNVRMILGFPFQSSK